MDKITQKDLLKLSKKELAKHLEDFLTTLSPGKRGRWMRQNMPELLKAKAKIKESTTQLLDDVENFIGESKSGIYVSWVSEGDYYDEDSEEEDDYSNFEEWTQNFGDLLTRTLKISQQGKYKIAVECFNRLFGLLSEASRTTDILGNQGAPEDYIKVDFSEAIALYTKSLLESKGKERRQEVLDIVMPLALRFRYWDGYRGLVSALDSEGRKVLSQRLWKDVGLKWKEYNERISPDEVDGLISIAEAEGDKKQALSIKEQFARANARYLKDILGYYEKKRDWHSLEKWAKIGQAYFGKHHREYASYLIKAKDALGDKEAVLDAKLEYFLENPEAKEFEDIRKYAESVSRWDEVLERLLILAGNYAKQRQGYLGLKIKLLLAIGREREALECMEKEKHEFGIEEIKFMAKYGLAKASSGLGLSNFPELKVLDRRNKREESDLYRWLRFTLKNPTRLERADYARISAKMYQALVDFHLNSGKSSRTEYAAYYCLIVKELSDLLQEPSIWEGLIQYMRQEYQKKRLIWKSLREKGLINECSLKPN